MKKEWFCEKFSQDGLGFMLRVEKKLFEEQTKYQKLEIYQTTDFGNLMVLDDCVMLTTRDNFLYHEMISHPALNIVKNPKQVAIIGGGDCGTLKEVLKHKEVEALWQIDIDEAVTRASEKYFPELCTSNADERANILFADGLDWIAQRENASLDVLIVDSTDPVGFAAGLFEVDFLKQCYEKLNDGGVLVQQSESPILHSDTIIKNLQDSMLKAGFETVKTLTFPQPCYPSGWWSVTLAGKGADLENFSETRAEQLQTKYYSAQIHKAAATNPPFMLQKLS